jgi:hypothetical protein
MLVASQQEAYLAAAGMTGELGKVCLAPFVCGSSSESMIGTEPFSTDDPAKIQSLFKEAGYDGEPLVLMDPTDQSNLHMLAQVLSEHMKKVELNVDPQAMDWSTLVSRRAIKTPPRADRGGWKERRGAPSDRRGDPAPFLRDCALRQCRAILSAGRLPEGPVAGRHRPGSARLLEHGKVCRLAPVRPRRPYAAPRLARRSGRANRRAPRWCAHRAAAPA